MTASQPVMETGTGAGTGTGTGTFRMIHQGDKNHMQKGKTEKAKAKAESNGQLETPTQASERVCMRGIRND